MPRVAKGGSTAKSTSGGATNKGGGCNTNKTASGGNIVSDLNKLAVPFGLIVAERGLKKLMKKDTNTAAVVAKSSPARKAAVGGKKSKGGSSELLNSSTGSKKFVNEINKLTSDIESFLAKY